eukprot:6476792-Lingulodinium_polyedra.AAC.1
MAMPSAFHLAPPLELPCFRPTCCLWLVGLQSYRGHCRGSRHKKRLRNVGTLDSAAPAWLTEMCRDALWVIYVRCA